MSLPRFRAQLLDQEQEPDLHRMYLLLSRIPNGLDPLRERFEQHVKKAGLDSVERAVGAAAAAPAEGDAKGAAAAEKRESAVEPKAYVDSLLAVHKKNSELVGKAFRGDQGFVASLDRVRRPVFLPLDDPIAFRAAIIWRRMSH